MALVYSITFLSTTHVLSIQDLSFMLHLLGYFLYTTDEKYELAFIFLPLTYFAQHDLFNSLQVSPNYKILFLLVVA